MIKNFTSYAFTDTVKDLQSRYGSRKAYDRMEKSGDRYILSFQEIAFIQSRDSFYLSTVGENDWPYVQHRGGPKGFLKVVDESTLRFADYTGNRQYISTGNIIDNSKVAMILMDYPTRQRVKIWATAKVDFAEDQPERASELEDPNYKAKIERIYTLEIQAYDWNCPKYIPQRYTLEEIKARPDLLKQLASNTSFK